MTVWELCTEQTGPASSYLFTGPLSNTSKTIILHEDYACIKILILKKKKKKKKENQSCRM